MQRIPTGAWHLLPPRFPMYSLSSSSQALFFARVNPTTLAIHANGLYAQFPAPVSGIRFFGSLNPFSKSIGTHKNKSGEILQPWDEVEAQRPLAPDPYDGTYQMPRGAPDARNLSRQQFHQFMHGKPQRFSKELKVAVMGISLTAFGIGVTWLTAYIMRPDDFEWVEEERRRIQEAKERIQQKIDNANKSQGGEK